MQQQGNVLLCVHDGWVVDQHIEVDDLADHIHATTGYRFGIEVKHLEAPGGDQIKRKLDEFEAFSEGELQFECPFGVTQGERRVVSSLSWSASDAGPVAGVSPTVGCSEAVTPEEMALWTSYPHPEVPVLARLAFVSPRPGWNLPAGSTADFVDGKRQAGEG
jgi:hypothetical protein